MEHFSIKILNSIIHTPLGVVLKCWLSWFCCPPFLPVFCLFFVCLSVFTLPPLSTNFVPSFHLFLFSFLHLHLTPSAFSVLRADSPPCPHLLNTTAIASQACSWAAALLLIRPLTAACLPACTAVSLKIWLLVCLLVMLFIYDFLHACLRRPPRNLQG